MTGQATEEALHAAWTALEAAQDDLWELRQEAEKAAAKATNAQARAAAASATVEDVLRRLRAAG